MTTKNRSSRDYNRLSNHNRHGRENHARDADRSRRIHKTDRFDRDFSEKYPVYDDRGVDRSRFCVRSSRSPRRGEMRGRFDRDGRVYDDYRDFDLEVARKSTCDNGKGFGYESFNSGERDHSESRYLDGGDVRRVSMEYRREGRMHSDSYAFDDNGRNGGIIRSSLERDEIGRHVSETGNTEKLGYFHRQNQLLLEKRNGDIRNHDELGIERPVERGSSKYVEEDIFSSRDSNFFSSLARSEDYISSSSGISRKNLPGRINAQERESDYLASESVHFDEYGGKRQYVSPRRYGDQINDKRQYVSTRKHVDQINDTRSRSRSYLGLPEETRVDHFYAGKSKIDRGIEEYREQHTSSMSVLDSTVEPSRGIRRGDDGLWEPYSSSRGQPTPYDGYGSMQHQGFHANVDGGRESHNDRYDVLRTREYEPPIVRLYDSPRKRGEPSESERRLVDEHYRDETFARHVSSPKKNAPNSSRQNYPQVSGVNKVDLVSLPRKKKSSKYDNEKKSRMPSQRIQSHSSNPVNSGSGIIKRRMGPVPKRRNLSQRVVQKYKKRSRPAFYKT